MISNNVLDIRSASSRFSRTEALSINMNPASVAAIAELLARVEELLRTDSRETVLSVGPLQLDLLARSGRRGERTIDLLPREFVLVEYMMRRQGQVLTRAMLFKEVWNYKFIPQSNLVDVHMGRLRRKIDQADEWPMICTIHGQGFVLRAPQVAATECRTHDRDAGDRLHGRRRIG
ncbi:MAG: two-component system, OmpR family, response regulator [Bradyrhizobium sp.]|jgi:DNA-binding winged helix-turn-helix (wHTH) protein|nr:two-component system, OmpR family, response regulator [Bradyrhizobium sp.]